MFRAKLIWKTEECSTSTAQSVILFRFGLWFVRRLPFLNSLKLKNLHMKNENILTIGKFFFWLSFTLGNICLFGYLISQNEGFAFYGFILLIFGSIINLLVVIGLMIYGVIIKSQLNVCMKASSIICINIPIAILYYFIGISLLNF